MKLIHYLLFLPPTFLGAWYLGTKFGNSIDLKDKKSRYKYLFWIVLLLLFTINVCLLTPLAVVFLYTCLEFLIYDLIQFVFKKTNLKKASEILKKTTFNGIILVLIAIGYTTYGLYNASHQIVTNYEITTPKEIKSGAINILLLSDLHLGTGSNCNTIDKIIHTVNKTAPDVFLIDGDLFDERTNDELKTCAYEKLGTGNTKYGTYYVEGNHDLLTDDARIKFNKNNINTLEDEVIKINDEFYIIGRKDKNHERLELSELITKVDRNYPIILLDHRPVETDIAHDLGVDLQLAGHTHAGQLFPGNLFVQSGTKDIDNYHLIISSGYGTWGAAIRTSKSDEIVNIIIKQ